MNRPIHLMLPIALGLAACHASATTHDAPSAEGHARVPTVEVLTVQRAPLVTRVVATGTAVAQKVADLASPAGGIAHRLHVQPGDTVRAGDVLVTYRNERIRQSKLQAEASAVAAETQAAHAAREVERLRPLVARGSIATTQLDSVSSQAQAAEAQARAAPSAANAAAEVAADLVLRAPFDGTVVDVSAQIGETASGAPAARIADLRTLELTVHVHERALPRVKAGSPVEVRFPNLDLTRQGTVSWVGMEIDPRTRTAEVVATVDNPDRDIPSGAFAEAVLVHEGGRNALVVPETAIASPSADPFVWVVDGSQAARASVRIHALGDGRAEILEGLDDGRTIVASRTSAVREGPVHVAGGAL